MRWKSTNLLDQTIRFRLHLHSLFLDRYYLPFPLQQTLYTTDLWASTQTLSELLRGIKQDFIDCLIQQPNAFEHELNKEFNVIFATQPGLTQSLLVITVTTPMKEEGEEGEEERGGGRRRDGEGEEGEGDGDGEEGYSYTHNRDCCCNHALNPVVWKLTAQIWGWGGIEPESGSRIVDMLKKRALQCMLCHVAEEYAVCVDSTIPSHPSLIVPHGDIKEWAYQYPHEVVKLKMDTICSIDVFYSFFFRELATARFVPLILDSSTTVKDVLPIRNEGCVTCTRCDGGEIEEIIHIGEHFDFLFISEPSSSAKGNPGPIISLVKVVLQQETGSNQVITAIPSHPVLSEVVDPSIDINSLLSHIPTSLSGTMTDQPPFNNLWMYVTLWSAPLNLDAPVSMSIVRETSRNVKHTVSALMKQARVE